MRDSGIEIWGGIECTVNRVGNRFHSQLEFSGHDKRDDDLDAIAALGIRTLRYPILWELTDPGAPAAANWDWPERRLRRLRQLGITPIVGLVHHGSGPPHTGLLEEEFARRLARFAEKVARRFSWVDLYTPINEPLTTARFSALYGLWYPHARLDRAFVQAMLNQCRAVALAMRAIRRVNPRARLVQTDDLGKVHSTPTLRHQAEFENERRWLTWDLLCGRVDQKHTLWAYLAGAGAREDEILWFKDNPCPPDVVGVNYYVTSERYLHDRPDLFPPHCRGGNGRLEYADVEAVRVLEAGTEAGIGMLLAEAWQRYQLPLALTEVHLGCSREEQMRWLFELWQAARCARERGADVRAVTTWALFGSYDWNTLLTEFTGCYEPGAFDVRCIAPRPTALARLVHDLASEREPRHLALLRLPGWWHRSTRLPAAFPGAASSESPHLPMTQAGLPPGARPVLVVGADGTLGQAFGHLCDVRGIPCILTNRKELDIGVESSIVNALDKWRPWAVINTAGYVRVDDAESDVERCYRENVEGAQNIALQCAGRGLQFITFSSDLVFDGGRSEPYVETDVVGPLNVYGRSKAAAETAVLASHPKALVVRTSALFGPWDAHNFLSVTLARLARGAVVLVPETMVVSPTYVPDLVNACLDLLFDQESGIWHLTNQGATSWADFARDAAARARVASQGLCPTNAEELGYRAERPAYSAMTSNRGMLLPSLEHALQRFVQSAAGRRRLAA
jgi:dTDP-4-dehydrorhamnose reductase